jgi:predicted RNA-binding Zn-ribbon protein involved in translation (DUF1610 family)
VWGNPSMVLLKSYSCSKCGGVLYFDSDQEFFDCPFCGNRFDIVDFHGEEILSQAEECLKQKDFVAAKEKYSLILAKNEKVFESLRGLVFCEAGLTSADDLKDPDNVSRNNLSKVKEAVSRAENLTSGANQEYFKKLSSMMDLVGSIKAAEKEGYVVRADANKGKFKKAEKELESKRKGWIMGIITIGLALILNFAFSMAGGFFDQTNLKAQLIGNLIAFSLLFGGFFIYSTIKTAWTSNDLKKIVRIGESGQKPYRERIADIKEQYNQQYLQLLEIEPMCGKGSVEDISVESASETSYDTEAVDENKTILCSKCAAQLILNKEKRIYECKSCGVGYGISLFFGLPLEKALNSMNKGFYSDAEQRFSNMLMADPSDFEALLGRILCKGRWTKVSSIDLHEDLTPTRIRVLEKEAGDAKEQALEPDKEFFEGLKELLHILSERAAVDYKINITNKKKDDADAQVRVYRSAQPEVIQASKEKIYLLDKELQTYFDKKKLLESHFENGLEKLLQTRSDSELAK